MPYSFTTNQWLSNVKTEFFGNGDITTNGKVGIGVDFNRRNANWTGYRLYVREGIRTEKVRIDVANDFNWADFVFEKNYKLKSLKEVEQFIIKNKHLPDVPSAQTIQKEGIDIAEMQKIQMQKIEELTLYLIELKKENEEIKKTLIQLQNR
ncbi:MAG: hypothetical protein EAZ44_09605 [Cytophagia bacterium]|nr:MAG: hypothetical protein EAZ44_09605 [Cytophagia bacterium]